MLGNGANQNSGSYEPNYYSRLRFRNDGDKLQLLFSQWKGTLKLTISEKPTSGEKPKEYAFIHLSPTKARIMAELTKFVRENPKDHGIYGVNTGVGDTRGLITIGNGENGIPYMIIGKVDVNGQFTQSQRYNFNSNYHYSLIIEDIQNLAFSKKYHDDAELGQLEELFTDYSRSANGMIGASVWDIGRYELNKANRLTFKIAEKLGVETKRGGGDYSQGSTSFFDKEGSDKPNPPSSTRSGSIDDMESEFD